MQLAACFYVKTLDIYLIFSVAMLMYRLQICLLVRDYVYNIGLSFYSIITIKVLLSLLLLILIIILLLPYIIIIIIIISIIKDNSNNNTNKINNKNIINNNYYYTIILYSNCY